MSKEKMMNSPSASRQNSLISLWFALDAILVLAPPLHWAAGSTTEQIAGMPAALLYFVSVSVLITASVIVAYINEPK